MDQIKYRRKVIRITALDSPNVQAGLKCAQLGLPPEQLIDGVLPYEEYLKRLETWDEYEKVVGLHAQYYSGPEILLYPPQELSKSKKLALELKGKKRRGKALGVDTAEGGDDTVWSVTDEYGLIKQFEMKTPDTTEIPGRTVAYGKMYGVPPERWIFDRGGGGYGAACTLRQEGYNVMTVPFGGSVTPEPGEGGVTIEDKIHQKEESFYYFDKRAQLYGILSEVIKDGYAIPSEYAELFRQLSKIPRTRDNAGRLKLLPKKAPKNKPSLYRILGRSPDQLESLALATFGLFLGPVEQEVEVMTF